MTPVLSTAFRTADHIKDSTSDARHNILEFGVQALKLLNSMRREHVRVFDGALEHVGLQRREGSFRPVAYFIAGAAVAGCAVLILAPTSGKEIRAKIASTIRATGKGVTSTIDRDSPRSEDDVTTSASEPSPKTSNGESTHKST